MSMMKNPRLRNDLESGQCLSSTSTKMGNCWKHSQPETKKGFLLPSSSTHLLKQKIF
uniref:Uncharacterized protein n=1 Tax=Medicago truncatula TaxID=3880 RepID=I3TA73_MEDTR|nr:unknown [Medicago truncatula]